MIITAGAYEADYEFKPQGYITASYVASFSSFAILLLLIAAIIFSVGKVFRQPKAHQE